MSIIWRKHDTDMITNGSSDRKVSEIVLYDESGPLITNYTNLHAYEFETERNISIRAIKSPDWTNPNGFLIREYNSYHARYESGAMHVLFIHVDNVPSYAREFLDYWTMYEVFEPGTIQCQFSLEGCTFNRIVGNPDVMKAKEEVNEATKVFNGINWMEGGFFTNYCTICHDAVRALSVYSSMTEVVSEYKRVCDRITESCGLVELIHANGADKPIGPNDYNDLHQYSFMNGDSED